MSTLSEQKGAQAKRGYVKTKRAEDEWRTRARIVDAAEHLHASLGPARTTVSAIAEQAGVTRATVYRHFADDDSLFLACSRQWLSRQRLPEPDAWSRIDDPVGRLRAALADIYRFYRGGEQMMTRIHHDAEVVPTVVLAVRREREQLWLDTLLGPPLGRRGKTVRAALAHATAFSTWQSLCSTQGLSDKAAVSLMVGMLERQIVGTEPRR